MVNLIQNIGGEKDNYELDDNLIIKLSKTLHFALLKTNIKGQIHFVSENVAQIINLSKHEIIGKKITSFLHEKDKKDLQTTITRLSIKPEAEQQLTVRIRTRDQSFIWVDMSIYKLITPDSIHNEDIIFIIKEIPLERDDLLFQSEKLSVIGQLAAGIAHEIRNPLTSLKGFIQLMKSDQSYSDHYLKIMESEINIIESISKELMILAKPNPSNYEICNLTTIYESCMTLLEGGIFQNRIQVTQEFDEEPIFIFCDEQKIKQVLINLIKNGVEAMEAPGKISIKITKNENFGVLSIKDEGKGIPQDMIKNLGKPFFTTKNNGNGLGLMMSYKIIEEHNGKIEVKSKVGRGTVFKVFLPLQKGN